MKKFSILEIIIICILFLFILYFPNRIYSQEEQKKQEEKKPYIIDMPNVEIVEALRALGEQAGLNIITGPNVTGRINVYLQDIPPEKAIEHILKTYGYSWKKQGNLLIVQATETGRQPGEIREGMMQKQVFPIRFKKASDVRVLAQTMLSKDGTIIVEDATNSLIVNDIQTNIDAIRNLLNMVDVGADEKGQITTQVFPLRFMPAEDMVKTLQKLLTERGKITIDIPTNSLIITDTTSAMITIERAITELDIESVRPKQVEIEARIMEVTFDSTKSFGINYQFNPKSGPDGSGSVGFINPVVTDVKNPNDTSPSGVFLKYNVWGIDQYVARIRAEFEENNFNVLSKPRVVTMDGQEARIQVGKRFPIVAPSTAFQPATTSFEEIGIILTITPHISKDRIITMEVHQEISDITGYNPNNQPIISKRDAKTVVYVRDGEVITLGGLLSDSQTDTVSKIPLLGDLPLIGYLFRYTKKSNNKTELVIMLCPKVLKDEGIKEEEKRNIYLKRGGRETPSSQTGGNITPTTIPTGIK